MQLVSMNGNQPTTTTTIVAEGTDSQHRAILQLVKQNLADFEEFGRVAFEMQPFETAGGTQKRTIAILNREHAMLLMTYMRNTTIVRDFKKRLIKAFVELENRAKESAPAIPQTYAEALRAAADHAERAALAERQAQQAHKQLEVARPKVEYHDQFIAESDLIQFRTLANQLNIGEQKLRQALQQHGWIYDVPCERWSNKQRRKVVEHRWRCKADKKRYFQLVPQHEAPRLMGEVRQTLKITPEGAAAITRVLRKWGVLNTPMLEVVS